MIQPVVTIILPVSRDFLVDRLFGRLEMLTCQREKTNLLVLVDGDNDLFLKVRNLVSQSKFNEKLCIQYQSKKPLKKFDKEARRLRIADINNEFKKYIWDSDYIFGIEDDTIFPENALSRLLKNYLAHPYAGMIEGLELGRWGVPYIGAWKVNSIYEPNEIHSIAFMQNELMEIDAGGFYCYLTSAESYLMHDFKPWADGNLGPDVDYGIELRKRGLKNYIDTSLICDHYTEKGEIINPKTKNVLSIRLKKNGRKWKYVN